MSSIILRKFKFISILVTLSVLLAGFNANSAPKKAVKGGHNGGGGSPEAVDFVLTGQALHKKFLEDPELTREIFPFTVDDMAAAITTPVNCTNKAQTIALHEKAKLAWFVEDELDEEKDEILLDCKRWLVIMANRNSLVISVEERIQKTLFSTQKNSQTTIATEMRLSEYDPLKDKDMPLLVEILHEYNRAMKIGETDGYNYSQKLTQYLQRLGIVEIKIVGFEDVVWYDGGSLQKKIPHTIGEDGKIVKHLIQCSVGMPSTTVFNYTTPSGTTLAIMFADQASSNYSLSARSLICEKIFTGMQIATPENPMTVLIQTNSSVYQIVSVRSPKFLK